MLGYMAHLITSGNIQVDSNIRNIILYSLKLILILKRNWTNLEGSDGFYFVNDCNYHLEQSTDVRLLKTVVGKVMPYGL